METVRLDLDSKTRSSEVARLRKTLSDEDIEEIKVIHRKPDVDIPVDGFNHVSTEELGHRYVTTYKHNSVLSDDA